MALKIKRRSSVPLGSVTPLPKVLPPAMEFLRADSSWRTTWTHIVAGRFSDAAHDGLLFYDQQNGFAAFYETDGAGGLQLLREHNDWRRSWSHIIPGKFSGSKYTGILLYDQQAGFGAFYNTDGHGGIIKLREHANWRNSWTQIVPGRFTASERTGLLFYDQLAGFGALYDTDGHGGIITLQEYDDWRDTWSQIVCAELSDIGGRTHIFFHEEESGYGEVYATDDDGQIVFRGGLDSLPRATKIVPGNFGWPWHSLLFYNQLAGRGAIVDFSEFAIDTKGNSRFTASVTEVHNDWRTSWSWIVPGNFWTADDEDGYFPEGGFTDLLFYESSGGLGEFYLHEASPNTQIEPLAGYASVGSVLPGETITFHVSSQVGPYVMRIWRQGAEEIPMMALALDLPDAGAFAVSRTAWQDGAQWPAVAHLTIPVDWPNGLYFARAELPPIVVDGGNRAATRAVGFPPGLPPAVPPLDIPFVVRSAQPGSTARILVTVQDTTYEAYNWWGGRNLYGCGTRAGFLFVAPYTNARLPRAFRVAFARPHTAVGDHVNKWKEWEVPFLRWAHRQGIPVEVCALSDLHWDPGMLANYRLLVVVGHSEYWSKEMRDGVERFVHHGGNTAYFAANTCWWQVRFEDDGQTMVCYKDKLPDPHFPQHPDTVTVNWKDDPVNRPETSLTGVSYDGTPTWPNVPLLQQFVVQAADHWVFQNTNLHPDDFFGLYDGDQKTVVGTETDMKQPSSPSNFTTLAKVCFRCHDAASMGIWTDRGTVFTAGTIDWARGLSQHGGWGVIDQITWNVLQNLG